MSNQQHLRELESQLFWCRDWYLLRLWQDCGSFNSASDFHRIQIAEELRADAEGRSKDWALQGRAKFVDHLTSKLDDPDPEIRQDAAIALGDYSPKDHLAVDVLIERLQSPDQTLHDRACAAWALGKLGAKSFQVVPILVALIEELKDQLEANEFRSYAAEAIENLTGEMDVLMKVAKHCIRDRAWECRMKGLFIVERLLKRQPELRDECVPLIEPLVKDEVEEISVRARRLLEGS